ncbi:MAG: Rieske 2Fe-2S domain-containing protein [Acidimicrobiales bacterium]|jgi:phenylpropionate dioxygenase-like ring-hydroxylating dioxygenase large terminal subunit|nr:Rieske 2Fe-2S domain-containing protein [Acidimicrobiales bacterium]
MSRFPFPIPFGWFQVAWSADLQPGDVRPLYYFGRDLVLWRDAEGTAHVQDAICPHLGAHLGHGGHVEQCNLQCPFHGWLFDGEGRNVEIPYAERPNGKARLRTYPVLDRNGLVLAWYHPEQAPPMWDIPEIPEFNDPQHFSPLVGRSFDIPAAWQEIAENQVDVAHFRYVHNTDIIPEVAEYTTEGHMAFLRSTQKFPTPRGVVDGRIDVDTYNPGFGVIRFSGIVDTVLMGCCTPVTAEECQLRFTFTVRRFDDAAFTSAVGDAFVEEVSRQVQEDIPIWKHKGHVTVPALAATDGPYLQFRKWASQFYAEGVTYDREVYPPNRPSSSEPEVEGVHKLTASARIKGEADIHAGMSSAS